MNMDTTPITQTLWITPTFEEIPACMECTAYSGGSGDDDVSEK